MKPKPFEPWSIQLNRAGYRCNRKLLSREARKHKKPFKGFQKPYKN